MALTSFAPRPSHQHLLRCTRQLVSLLRGCRARVQGGCRAGCRVQGCRVQGCRAAGCRAAGRTQGALQRAGYRGPLVMRPRSQCSQSKSSQARCGLERETPLQSCEEVLIEESLAPPRRRGRPLRTLRPPARHAPRPAAPHRGPHRGGLEALPVAPRCREPGLRRRLARHARLLLPAARERRAQRRVHAAQRPVRGGAIA